MNSKGCRAPSLLAPVAETDADTAAADTADVEVVEADRSSNSSAEEGGSRLAVLPAEAEGDCIATLPCWPDSGKSCTVAAAVAEVGAAEERTPREAGGSMRCRNGSEGVEEVEVVLDEDIVRMQAAQEEGRKFEEARTGLSAPASRRSPAAAEALAAARRLDED